MREGDALFLARDRSDSLYFIVAPQGSTSERQLLWLFGLQPDASLFASRSIPDDGSPLGFAARFILEELGIEVEEPESDRLDDLIESFGLTFPTTAVLSDLARQCLPTVRAEDDPDDALLAWLAGRRRFSAALNGGSSPIA